MNVILEALLSILFMFLTEVFGKEVSERGGWFFSDETEEAFLEDNRRLFRELELLRQQYYSSYRFRKRVAPTIFFVLIFLPPAVFVYFLYGRPELYKLIEEALFTTLAFSAFMIVFLMPWLTSPKRQYVKEYKKAFLPKVAFLFFEDFKYSQDERYGGGGFLGSLYYYFFRKPEDNPRKASLLESKIVPGHRVYHADDVFEGTCKGVRLFLADITLRSYSQQKGGAVTVFQGLLIEIDLGKASFHGHTAVLHNKTAFLDFSKQCPAGLKRVKVPAPEFEQAFNAYGTDQVEARYLLDPAMMERLLGIYKEFSGQGMAVAFYKNKVMILISTSYNPFEPDGLFTPAGCHHSILRVKKEFENVLSLIDRLKLYDPQRGARFENAPV